MKLPLLLLATLLPMACGTQITDKRINSLDQKPTDENPGLATHEGTWEKCFNDENDTEEGRNNTSSKSIFEFGKNTNGTMTVNQYLGRDCDESRAVSTETASMTYEISEDKISISTFDTTLELRFKLSQDKMYLSFDPSKEATVKEASEFTRI